jgi:hypothetical protein
MGTMIELENDLDLCPICGAGGMELCVEEDGQTVLDHWGRPATWTRPAVEWPADLRLTSVPIPLAGPAVAA